MPRELKLHVADDAERVQAYRNLHDPWGGGMEPEAHLQHRLTYPKHCGTTWYVGTLDGRVVVGCGCYPSALSIGGRIEAACAFGEVHTLPEFRGQGFAPRLLAFAEEDQRRHGRTFSFLYSDIDVNYYARLGYVLCPCHQGWREPVSSVQKQMPLKSFKAADELPELARAYDAYHAPLSLFIARSPDYWRYLVARNPKDEFFWLEDGGSRMGYVRVSAHPKELLLREWSLTDRSDGLFARMLESVIGLAASRKSPKAGGWLPDHPAVRRLFKVTPRTREITMIKPLAGGSLTTAQVAAVDEFHEMDHV